MKIHHLPGFAITVVQDQNILYEKAIGYADLENNKKVSSASIFKLWSVSKAFTAMEIFREVEEGLIDLDDPLSNYLPDFKIQSEFGEKDQITIRSILAHQSGLPRNECVRVPISEGQTGSLDRFEIGSWACIKATPTGTRYKYSNLGYDLLGRVIEENRQTGYSRYMRSHFLSSLGMENSTFDSRDIANKESLVLGYDYHKRKYYPMIQHDINSVPSGNLYASLEDLTIFLKSVFKGCLFMDVSALPKMFESHYSTQSNPETMGLGWKTTRLKNSELLVWHDGGPSEGIGALIAILPNQKIGIAMVANGTSFDGVQSVQLASQILEQITENEADKNNSPKAKTNRATVDPKLLESYEGNYIAWGSVMKVRAKKDKLKGRISGIGLNMIPLSETEFILSNWMDQVGLTKLFRLPMDLKKIRISFGASGHLEQAAMIINMDNFNHEICPLYPDEISLPESMQTLSGTYEMAWRLPYNKQGPSSGSMFTISFEDQILTMSGIFGPILPLDEHRLKILSGPFAGEIIEYDQATGQLYHQNGIFVPQV
jgi:CubicO group peptidase (beta-lactamase class C family)